MKQRRGGGGAGAKRRQNWSTETTGPSARRGQPIPQTAVPPPLIPYGQG